MTAVTMTTKPKHTKEPWPDDCRMPGRGHLLRSPTASDGVFEYMDNIARSVVCVNACAGMEDPTEEITKLKAKDARKQLCPFCYDGIHPFEECIRVPFDLKKAIFDAPLLLADEFRSLATINWHSCVDWADDDTRIKELTKSVLPDFDTEGVDGYFVDTVQCAEALAARIRELEEDAAK